jgi:hypothetical protein
LLLHVANFVHVFVVSVSINKFVDYGLCPLIGGFTLSTSTDEYNGSPS